MELRRLITGPVPVTLGGRSFFASEFRVSDMAELFHWAADRLVDPFERSAFDIFNAPPDREWKRLLARVLDEIDAGEDALTAMTNGPEGVVKQIQISLRRTTPGLTEQDVAEAIQLGGRTPLVTGQEIERIVRIAWAVDPKQAIRSLVDGPMGGGGESVAAIDWAAMYYRYITTVKGGAPAFADQTLSQFQAWLRAGKDVDEDRPDVLEVAARRVAFWKDIESPGSDGEDKASDEPRETPS